MVFDGFQTLNNVRAAESNVFATRESLLANEMQILLSAATIYSNIARDQQLVSIRKQNIAFLQEQVNAAKARLDVGEGTRTDVSLAEASLANAQSQLIVAVAQLKQSEATYVRIVGDLPKNIKQASPASKSLPRSLDQAVASGLRDHPTILAAQYSVDSAGYQVKSAEGTMLPGVTLQGQVGRTTGNVGDGIDSNTSSITARLEVPIYQGGLEYGQIRQAKERLGQQRILVDSARASIQETIVSAYAQLEAAIARISANKAQISAAKLALDGVIFRKRLFRPTHSSKQRSRVFPPTRHRSLPPSWHWMASSKSAKSASARPSTFSIRSRTCCRRRNSWRLRSATRSSRAIPCLQPPRG